MTRIVSIAVSALAFLIAAVLLHSALKQGEELPADPKKTTEQATTADPAIELIGLKLSRKLERIPTAPPQTKSVATPNPQPASPNSSWFPLLLLGIASLAGFAGGYFTRQFPTQALGAPGQQPWDKGTIRTELLPEVESKERAFEALDDHHEQLEAQIAKQQEEIAQLKCELASAGECLEAPLAEIATLKSEAAALQKELVEQANTHTSELNDSAEALKTQESLVVQLRDEIQTLKQSAEEAGELASQTRDNFEEKLKNLTQARQELEQSHAQSKAELQEQIQTLQARESTAEASKDQITKDLEARIGVLEEQKSELEASKNEMVEKTQVLNDSNESLRTELARAIETSNKLKDDYDDHVSELQEDLANASREATVELARREQEIKHLQEEQDELKNSLSSLDEANGNQAKEIQSQQQIISDLEQSVKGLETSRDELEQSKDQELLSLNEELAARIAEAEVQSSEYLAKEQDLTAEVDQLRSALDTATHRADSAEKAQTQSVSKLEAEVKDLGDKLQSQTATVGTQDNQLQKLAVDNEALSGELSSVKRDLAKASSRNVSQLTHLQQLQATVQNQVAELESAYEAAGQQSSKLEEVTKELQSKENELEGLQARCAEADRKEHLAQSWLIRAEAAEKELGAAHEELASRGDTSKDLEQELLQSRQEIEELTQSLEATKNSIGDLQAIHSDQENDLSRWLSAITDISYKSEALPAVFKTEDLVEDELPETVDFTPALDQLEALVNSVHSYNQQLSGDAQSWKNRAEAAEEIAASSTEELDLLRNTTQNLRNSLEKSRKELTNVTDVLRQRESDLERFGNEVNERQDTIESLQSRLRHLNEKTQNVHFDIASEEPNQISEETHQDFGPALDELEQLLGTVDAQRLRWTNDAKQWHERAARAESELESSELELRTLRDGYKQVIEELNDSKEALVELRQAMQQKQEAVDQLSATSVLQRDNMASYISYLATTVDKMSSIAVDSEPADSAAQQSEIPDMLTPLDELDRLLSQFEEHRLVMANQSAELNQRLEQVQENSEQSVKENESLKTAHNETQAALQAAQSEIANLKDALNLAQEEARSVHELGGQISTQHINYLSVVSKVNNKIAAIQPTPEGDESDLELVEFPQIAPSLDTLETILSKLQSTHKNSEDTGNPSQSDQVRDLEKSVASQKVTIQRLKRGIDQLRHYQEKVKNWNSTVEGYRADIKRKSDVIDKLRDQNTDLRKLETVVAERDKSIATLVTALKHDGTNIRKLKRRLGKWKRRCVMLENSLRTSGIAVEDGDEKQQAAAQKTINLSSDRDRPKGMAPAWVKAPARSDKQPDDLTKIDGVDDLLAETLNQLGIYRFEQLANFDENDINWLAYLIDSFPTRIHKGKWVQKAQALTKSAMAS